MVQRERFEEYQKHLYLGRVLMSLFGNETTDTQQIARAEELLELAIFQTAYDPRKIRKQMETVNAVAQAEREKRFRDARLLAKVASYDASNDDSTDTFRNMLNKRGKQ